LNSVLACGSVTEQKSFIRSFVRDIEVAKLQIRICGRQKRPTMERSYLILKPQPHHNVISMYVNL